MTQPRPCGRPAVTQPRSPRTITARQTTPFQCPACFRVTDWAQKTAIDGGGWLAGECGGSVGLDLGFINIGAYNQNGSKGLTFGIFGGEVRDDYTNGQLTQTFGAHYGFGIEGIASAGVSAWSDGTFSATAAIGPVSGGLSYNVNGGGLCENLGLGLYGMPGESFSGTLGYGWSFSKNGTQGGFNVNVNASGYARDHFGSGWNSLQDAYDKFNNGFMGNWARTPNGGETLLPGGGLLNFDPGTGIISVPFFGVINPPAPAVGMPDYQLDPQDFAPTRSGAGPMLDGGVASAAAGGYPGNEYEIGIGPSNIASDETDPQKEILRQQLQAIGVLPNHVGLTYDQQWDMGPGLDIGDGGAALDDPGVQAATWSQTQKEAYALEYARQSQEAKDLRLQRAQAQSLQQSGRIALFDYLSPLVPATANAISGQQLYSPDYIQFTQGSVYPLLKTGLTGELAAMSLPISDLAIGGEVAGAWSLTDQMAGGTVGGAGLDALRQRLQIADGAKDHFDWNEVAVAGFAGCVTTPIALEYRVTAGLTFGTIGAFNVYGDLSQGQWRTGIFDAGTSALALYPVVSPYVVPWAQDTLRPLALGLSMRIGEVGMSSVSPYLPDKSMAAIVMRLSQLDMNGMSGEAWEATGAEHFRSYASTVQTQVYVRPILDDGSVSSRLLRLDGVGVRTPEPGIDAYEVQEWKASDTASLTRGQRWGFPLIQRNGFVIVSYDAGAQLPRGLVIPPTSVRVVRPSTLFGVDLHL